MRRSAGLLLAGWLAAAPAGALHITDKLAVGLYDSPKDEQPRRVLTSGTPLEVLDRGDRLCRVRLGDGDSGWLECRYLTDEKPARALLLEAQAQTARLRQELEALRNSNGSLAPTPAPPLAAAPTASSSIAPLATMTTATLGVLLAALGGVLLGIPVGLWLSKR